MERKKQRVKVMRPWSADVLSAGEPIVTAEHVEHVDYPGWVFSVRLGRDRGLLSLGVSSEESLSWRKVRDAPVGEITNEVRRQVFADVEASMLGASKSQTSEVRALGAQFRARPRPGRAGRDVRDYAALARRYVELCTSGSPNAAASLADELHLSLPQVRNLVTQARRRGLLTPAPPGKQGGSLTDKARLELARED